MTNEAQTAFMEAMPVTGAGQLKAVLDYDLPKIGVGLPIARNAITAADTNLLSFWWDSSRAGQHVDSQMVTWSVVYPVYNHSTNTFPGGNSIRDSLPNPNEIWVYRRLQKGASVIASNVNRVTSYGITAFRFDYYDATGAAIGTPVIAANLQNIKLIKVTFKAESRWRIPKPGETTPPTLNAYPNLIVVKYYRPRNLL